jgi:uncharacterized protein
MRILFNNDGYLRSGWRAALFLTAYLLISSFLIIGAVSILSQLQMGGSSRSFLPLTLPFALSAVTAIILGLLFGKYFEGIRAEALGLTVALRSVINTLLGFAVGSFAITTAVIIGLAAGSFTVEQNVSATSSQIWSTLGYTFLIFLVGALSEEALFRGYLLQTFVRDNTIMIGIVFTSLLFALAHNQNPSAGRLSLINTFAAGVWFAAAYLKTRDLWFPLGIHLMWNWLQGPVFGINVSGIAELSPYPLLQTSDLGPEWLTGGAYGIEGGAACTFVIVIFTLILFFTPKWGPTEMVNRLEK